MCKASAGRAQWDQRRLSCNAGATWSTRAILEIGDGLGETGAQTTVSGGPFTAYWTQETEGPSGYSIFASSLVGACGLVPPAPGPALAATGSSVATGGVVLAGVILALGVGFVAARRRAEA